MFGRGVYDMKMAAACYIRLFRELHKKDNLSNYNIGIMLVSDEEIGGSNGVGYLLNEGGVKGSIAFIPDGGFNWKIEEQAKGVLQLKLKSHTSFLPSIKNSKNGDENAISKLMYALYDLSQLYESKKNSMYHSTVSHFFL